MEIIKNNCIEYANLYKKGVIIRDIMSLMVNTNDRKYFFELLVEYYKDKIDVIVGPDSKGYLFSILSDMMNIPFLPIRKRTGKIPNTIFKYYNSEYGCSGLEVQVDLINKLPKGKHSRILVIDDVIATGESILAIIDLLKKVDYRVTHVMCPVELLGLGARDKLNGCEFISFYKVPYNITKNDYLNKITHEDHESLKYKLQELEYTILDYSKLVTYRSNLLNDLKLLNTEVVTITKLLNKNLVKVLKYDYISTEDDNRVILFYHYDMESMAEDIVNMYPNHFRLGKINWNYFPDQWYNISFETPLNNKNVVFLGTLFDPKKFLETAMMGIIFPRQHINSFTYVIPYFAPATFERVQKEGILASAEPVAKLLTSCLRDTKGESCILKIYDIHALPVRFYFTDNCIIKHLTAIPLIKNIIKKEMLTVCFADDGAVKRFKQFFSEFPMVICSKERIGTERKIVISDMYNFNREKNMEHVIIIDDLVQTGNTLHECRKALICNGFKKVSCYVTHAVFPNECYNEFLEDGPKYGFENFYVTNTNPIITNKLSEKPFIVLNINNHLANDIINDLQIHTNNIVTPLNVHVATTNQNKLEAVNISLNKVNSEKISKYYPINIYGYDIKSNINNQPIGYSETQLGANNRINQLCTINNDTISNNLYISIESGYCTDCETKSGFDFAVILVKYRDILLEEISDRIYIDEKDLDIADICVQDPSITIGSELEKRYGYPNGQWHEYYSNTSRTEQLVKPLTNILQKLLN